MNENEVTYHIKTRFNFELFANEESGLTAHKVKLLDISPETDKFKIGSYIIIKGYHLPKFKEITYEMEGSIIHDAKYGFQFSVSTYIENIRSDKNEIISYLASGTIKGIGNKLAERIYEMFGADTLKTLDDNPALLKHVKGISNTKLENIIQSYEASRSARDIILYLSPFGVTTKQIMKVYKVFGNKTLLFIEKNPYILCELPGFGFETVDLLARKSNYDLNSPFRIKAAIIAALEKNERSGHSGCETKTLLNTVRYLLGTPTVSSAVINAVSLEMLKLREVISACGHTGSGTTKTQLIYRPCTYKVESNVARLFIELVNTTTSPSYKALDMEIQKTQKELNIVLHGQQALAVKTGLQNSVTIITGGPGTGKTAVLNTIFNIYNRNNPDKIVCMLAPTGRAARRMTESTNQPASTIHSALGIDIDSNWDGNETNDEFVLEGDLIIVDEFSMVDIWLAEKLLAAIPPGAQLLLVGDPDQLPSVGSGAVLHDFLDAAISPIVMLTKTFRQQGASNILENSKHVREGNTQLVYGSDFEKVETTTLENMEDEILRIYLENISLFGINNTVCLIPVKDKAGGVYSLNARIQESVNPLIGKQQLLYRGTSYRPKDIVMHLKNNATVSNGDIGVVTVIGKDEDGEYIDVEYFGDTLKRYHRDDLDSLILAYCMTIHKSQGSEYDSVITCLCSHHYIKMKTRNLFYTAITRAKKKVTILGDVPSFNHAIKTVGSIRNTLLADKLRFIKKKIEQENLTNNPFTKKQESR